ncbi:MAG: zf-TFIIB domain-containing protein [Alphaproteobacteria bacterium]|nr:zf-TFIIB domain-containing protein [Alphaproteobacteria bacterium]MBV9370165.1 zf-TFIIB domain-containing protein [Alphaproteobacteria bacterium]MBV9901074.1 zf-TFIIB domain-containing protein [Alphaproteobacteria bacterium]
MACPIDRTPLVMTERQGIEIDYCPTCRGVWLDRGELDKIVERSAAAAPPARDASPWGGGERHRYEDDRRHHGHRKRRKSFLEELFD